MINTLLLKSVCVAAVVFGMATPSSACWWPFSWHSYPVYRPVYPAYYGPGCSTCSPCGPGGCGVRTYYAPAACGQCGCAPCSCAPCGIGCSPCGNGCGVDVGYAPDTGPVPDTEASDGGGDNRTYAEEEADPTSEGPPRPAPGDDDFGPASRGDTATDERDPFQQPTTSEDEEEEADPQPLNVDDEGITLRVMPTRHRVRAEARYRVPRMVRLEVTPQSPGQPGPVPAHVASR